MTSMEGAQTPIFCDQVPVDTTPPAPLLSGGDVAAAQAHSPNVDPSPVHANDELLSALRNDHQLWGWAIRCAGGDYANAEELRQTMLVKMWKFGAENVEGSPMELARTIISHAAYDMRSRASYRLEVPIHPDEWVDGPNTRDGLDQVEDRIWVLGIVANAGLSPNQKEVIARHYLTDELLKDVAVRIGTSESTAKAHNRGGMGRLRRYAGILSVDNQAA